MNTLVARRAFLGTAAAAGAGLVGHPLSLAGAETVHPAAAADAVGRELLAQLRLAVTGIGQAHGGASARQAVGVLRIAAAHYRAQGFDRAFGQHLRTQLRVEGRQAVLRQPIDRERLAVELATFGIDDPPPPDPLDPIRREQALETLLATGPMRQLLAGTDRLERLASRLDRRTPGFVPVRFQDEDYYECPDLSPYTSMFEVVVLGTCIWNPIVCALFSGLYGGLLIGLLITGCSESA
jgi:hypothetical protein